MILIDTSVFIAHCNAKDVHHQRAQILMNALKSKTYGEVYLTNYIFSECATVLSLRIKDFHKAIKKTKENKKIPINF